MLRSALGSIRSFVGVAAILAAVPAWAVPIVDKSQAVADPRPDPGTGLCGTVTHFTSGTSIVSKADAVALMNKPSTDPIVLGRTARLLDDLNFRNGQPNTTGDFTLPNYRDEVLPYSIDPMATPMGTDNNIAMRLRGYFNVTAALAGKTISFGANCDDFCALRIGTTDLLTATELVSARVIKQVTFQAAGLYPIELIYYQNSATAFLELARTDTAVSECPNDVCTIALTDAAQYGGQFKLLPTTELYSSIVGSNPGCQECGSPGMDCSVGNYCGAGLCQTCNVSDHCGPGCVSCPSNARLCTAGKCVQCVADDQCPNGQSCDIPQGSCVPPQPCSTSAQCSLGRFCDPDVRICVSENQCDTDAMCPAGKVCSLLEYHTCRTKPVTTDPSLGPMVSGCSAARLREPASGRAQATLASLVLLFGAAALVASRRARRRSGA